MASLDKAFKLIDVLASRGEAFGLTELARAAELDKGTTHRLLEQLIGYGYVNRSSDAPKYELSLKLWSLGCKVVSHRSILKLSHEYLQRLVRLTGETTYLTINDHLEAVYMARVDSPRLVRAHTPMGGRVPLYAGSTGKALLAYLPEWQIAEATENLKGFTKFTITDANKLREELARVRAKGYSTSVGEWEESISGVAAPVFGHDGHVIASLGVTGPVERLDLKSLEKLGPDVAEIALELSTELGFQGSPPARKPLQAVRRRMQKIA